MNIIGAFDGVDNNGVARGWAFDADNPSANVTITVYKDGVSVGTVGTGVARPDLLAGYPQFTGQGNAGFALTLPASVRDGAEHYIMAGAGGQALPGGQTVQLAAPAATTTTATAKPFYRVAGGSLIYRKSNGAHVMPDEYLADSSVDDYSDVENLATDPHGTVTTTTGADDQAESGGILDTIMGLPTYVKIGGAVAVLFGLSMLGGGRR